MDFGQITLWTTLIADPLAAIIIIAALLIDRQIEVVSKWQRVGLTITACGLIGQTYRSCYAIFMNYQPTDAEMPFWVFKDVGIVTLALYYAYLICKKSKWN